MIKKGKLQFGLMATIACFLAFTLSSSAFAGPKELKLGWVCAASPTDPYNITAVKFKELVEKYSSGKYVVHLFPNGQLGSERDMIKNLTLGAMDLGVITNAPVGSFINAFMALDLPFIFPDSKTAQAVLDGEAGKMLLEKLSKLNIKGLAYSEGGFRNMINNVRPIQTPEDTKGVKFRVMKTPIYIGLFQSLGSNAVPMPWGEVFTAVQQKVIDGLEVPVPIIYANKMYEVTKYLSLTNHTYSPLIIMCSGQRWKKFSDEEKALFSKAAQEAANFERIAIKGIINDTLKKLEGEGMVINEVPNKKPFQEAVKPMYKDFEKKIGKDVLDAVLKARDAVN